MNNGGKSALGLDQNVAAGIAYIPFCLIGVIMSIIILVTDKTNKFARFHAVQSLLFAAVCVVLYICAVLFFFVAAMANSSIISILASLLWFLAIFLIIGGFIVLAILAFMGKDIKLPVIGGLADKWSN